MKTISVKDRILDVLVSNQTEWLRADQIAEIGYGDAYIRDTKASLNAKIARNINRAVASALADGIVILSMRRKRTQQEIKEAKRRSVTNNVSELNPLHSYKVATETDEDAINSTLAESQKAIDSRILIRGIKVDTLKSNKLISGDVLKELD